MRLRWHDERFRWNPEDHGNITELRLPTTSVWKPDITLYNVLKDESGHFDFTIFHNIFLDNLKLSHTFILLFLYLFTTLEV